MIGGLVAAGARVTCTASRDPSARLSHSTPSMGSGRTVSTPGYSQLKLSTTAQPKTTSGPRTRRRSASRSWRQMTNPKSHDPSTAVSTPPITTQASDPISAAKPIMLPAACTLIRAAAAKMINARRTGRRRGARVRLSVTAGLSAGNCEMGLILRSDSIRVLPIPGIGGKRPLLPNPRQPDQSASESCRKGIGLRYLHRPYPAVVDGGEPPAFGAPHGDYGVAGYPSFGQLRPPGHQDRATAVEHGHIVGDVANGLDLTDEGRTEQHAAKQLVVRLDDVLSPVCPSPVERDVIAVGGKAVTIGSRVAIGPCLAQPLK